MKRIIKFCFSLALLMFFAFLSLSCADKKPGIEKEAFDLARVQFIHAFDEIETAIENESEARKNQRTHRGQGPLVSPRSTSHDGDLNVVPSADWTSGFFPGSLWYVYEYTNDDFWREKAEDYTMNIEDQQWNGRTHDMGFKMYCSFGNGLRLTDNDKYKEILIQSAKTLITRYHPVVGAIRSWDHNSDKWDFPVIIDNMLNLELLFWATKVTGDSVYYDIANNHALTTLKNHFRDDYSTWHVLDYDTLTGEVINRHTHQGYSHDSSWSRGQAWALYGFTMSYRETGNIDFLNAAKQVAEFIFNHPNLPEDLIPYWDFDAPNIPDAPRDVSAGAVMASALYELSTYQSDNLNKYELLADKMMESMYTNHLSPPHKNSGFLLDNSTGHLPHGYEIDVPLVYADYYFLEALLRKKKISKNEPLFSL